MGFVRKECGMGFALARQAHKETMGAFLRLVNPGDSLHRVSRWHVGMIRCQWEMTSGWLIRVIGGSLLCAFCALLRQMGSVSSHILQILFFPPKVLGNCPGGVSEFCGVHILYMTTGLTDSIQKITSNGSNTVFSTSNLSGPEGIAFDKPVKGSVLNTPISKPCSAFNDRRDRSAIKMPCDCPPLNPPPSWCPCWP
jgi:hypothetical protein